MGRRESGRAAHVMATIVVAGWHVSLAERTIRRYAVTTALVLGAVVGASVELLAGAPAVGVVIGLLAPLWLFVVVAAGFRAVVFELAGDVHPEPPRVRDVLRRAALMCSDVLEVSRRALLRRDARSPLAAAIVVVNGVSAREGVRTSDALVRHRWGADAMLTSGLLFGALFVLPVAIVDAVVAMGWSHFGTAQTPLLIVAITLTIVGLVVALALDAGMRGALLRTARRDEFALPPNVTRIIVVRDACRSSVRGAYRQALLVLAAATVVIALLPGVPTAWFAAFVLSPVVLAALLLLRRAYRRPGLVAAA